MSSRPVVGRSSSFHIGNACAWHVKASERPVKARSTSTPLLAMSTAPGGHASSELPRGHGVIGEAGSSSCRSAAKATMMMVMYTRISTAASDVCRSASSFLRYERGAMIAVVTSTHIHRCSPRVNVFVKPSTATSMYAHPAPSPVTTTPASTNREQPRCARSATILKVAGRPTTAAACVSKWQVRTLME